MRVLGLLLSVLVAGTAWAHDCTPGLVSDITPRLGLEMPKAGQCNWDDELRAFFLDYDTRGAVLDLPNTFTPLQTFSNGINIPGSAAGQCWVATDTSGNGAWAACGLTPGDSLLDTYESGSPFMLDVFTLNFKSGFDLTNDGSGTTGVVLDYTEDPPILGTETDGNYVAAITNGTCVTGSPGAAEGATMTLALDQTCSPTLTGTWDFSGGSISLPTGAVDAIGEVATGLRSSTDVLAVKVATTTNAPADGCAQWQNGGLLGSTGTACGAGGTGSGDSISVNGSAVENANFVTNPTSGQQFSDLLWSFDAATNPDELFAMIRPGAVTTDLLSSGGDTPATGECVKVAGDTNNVEFASCGSSGSESVCFTIRNPGANHTNLGHLHLFPGDPNRTLVAALCRCVGACTLSPTFSFKDTENNTIPLVGGGALACTTGTGMATETLFDTVGGGSANRILVGGEGLLFSVANSPAVADGDAVQVCVR